MTTKQWYRVLVEKHVTMISPLPREATRTWRPSKFELNNPDVNWDRSWSYTRLRGLNSDQTSFLFKLLHNILPTNERLYRLNLKDSQACSLCTSGNSDNLEHAFLECSHNNEINAWLLRLCRNTVPSCSVSDIVHLNLSLSTPLALPVIWILSHTFHLVWNLRCNKKAINRVVVRAELEARVNILRKSRLAEAAYRVEGLMDL